MESNLIQAEYIIKFVSYMTKDERIFQEHPDYYITYRSHKYKKGTLRIYTSGHDFVTDR